VAMTRVERSLWVSAICRDDEIGNLGGRHRRKSADVFNAGAAKSPGQCSRAPVR
jgi:hypothetical protein